MYNVLIAKFVFLYFKSDLSKDFCFIFTYYSMHLTQKTYIDIPI